MKRRLLIALLSTTAILGVGMLSVSHGSESGDKARAEGKVVDLVQPKSLWDAALANVKTAELTYEKATALYRKPRWPDKFEPVVPLPITPDSTLASPGGH